MYGDNEPHPPRRREEEEISSAVRVQVRLDSARAALWAAMNAVPEETEYDFIRLTLGLVVNLAEVLHTEVRKKTGV